MRQLHREHRIRVVERDDQCVIVLDLQAGQLRVIADIRVLQFVVALDDGHAARLLHGVLDVRRIAPGIGEGTGGNGLAVGEFPAVVDYDGELRSVIVRRDRLGDFEMLLAVHVIADQTLKQVTDDLAATHFVGVGGLLTEMMASPGFTVAPESDLLPQAATETSITHAAAMAAKRLTGNNGVIRNFIAPLPRMKLCSIGMSQPRTVFASGLSHNDAAVYTGTALRGSSL